MGQYIELVIILPYSVSNLIEQFNQTFLKDLFYECVVLVSEFKNSVKLYFIYKQLKEYPMFEKGTF